MSDEEKRMFEKYIKHRIGILQRIKYRYFPRKRIKTIKDVQTIPSIALKLMYVVLIIYLLKAVFFLGLDVYYCFFPKFEPVTYPPFIPILRRVVS